MNHIKLLLGFAMLVSASGCAYGDIAGLGKGHVVITRNDHFLFGALRKAFVCKVGTSGLSNCVSNENP